MSYTALKAREGTSIAAATTLVLPSNGEDHTISGTTTITAIDDVDTNGLVYGIGAKKCLTFSGASPMTHNGTSFILIGGASRTNAAGDVSVFRHKGSGNWQEIARNKAGENTDKGHVSGLILSWTDATNISVSSGECYIEGAAAVVGKSTATTVTPTLTDIGPDLMYVYAYNNSGTLAFEASITEPTTAYFGTARSKTADTSRRLVGCFEVDSSDNIVQFVADDRNYSHVLNSTGDRTVVSGGSATTFTNINCGSIVGKHGSRVKAGIYNGGAEAVYVSHSSYPGGSGGSLYIPAGTTVFTEVPLNTSQQIGYVYNSTAGGSGLRVDVHGYEFVR